MAKAHQLQSRTQDRIVDLHETKSRQTLLGSRFTDFWLVGGLSLLVWALMTLGAHVRMNNWAVNRYFLALGGVSTTLAIFVNYPHFIVSYKLSYGQGMAFVKRFWFQMALVPAMLLASIVAGWFLYRNPAIGSGSLSGPNLMGSLVMVMYFTVGWHYAKQIFGVMMVYAKFDGYKLTDRERLLIKCAVFGVAVINYLNYSGFGATKNFFNLSYTEFMLPQWIRVLGMVTGAVAIVACLVAVPVAKWRKERVAPPLMFMLPLVTYIIWWIPQVVQPEFYSSLVPMFHSLQYLCFVKKSEQVAWMEGRGKNSPPEEHHLHLTLYVAGFIFASWAAFELVPSLFDATWSPVRIEGFDFFFIAANLFINIHHYFIDNVLWRFQTSEVAKRLLR